MAKKKSGSSCSGSKYRSGSGGLNAAGRACYKRKEGSNLQPGVKKVNSNKDACRKGSWIARHVAKSGPTPDLKKKNGEPTPFAGMFKDWGEPIPTTASAVQRVAAKKDKLLAQCESNQKKPRRGKKNK